MPGAETTRRALIQLARQSTLAGRWPIVLPDDLPSVDTLTGGRNATLALLRDLTQTDQLQRIRRGAYILRDETGIFRTDLFQLIDAITPQPYLITAGRALAAHELSDQYFRQAIVLVSTSRRSFIWRGDQVRYALLARSRIWGRQERKGPSVARPERALLDSMAHREWGVTLSQSAQALDIALRRDPQFAMTLAAATSRYRNAALARRLGYLVEAITDESTAAPFHPLTGPSKAVTLLEKSGSQQGPIDSIWGVRVNIELEDLLAHRIIG
jgi:predicted transcriptional regulator of viral defense system